MRQARFAHSAQARLRRSECSMSSSARPRIAVVSVLRPAGGRWARIERGRSAITSSRRRISQLAYRNTLADLRNRRAVLEPVLARHGIRLRAAKLKTLV